MFQDEQFRLKVGLAEMLKGGVIMDVVNAEQAVIAERAGVWLSWPSSACHRGRSEKRAAWRVCRRSARSAKFRRRSPSP